MSLAALAMEPPLSDETLAERVRGGSRGAFVVLVARYEQRVYRLALRMSRNESDAEEITQETFLRLYRSIGTFQGESRFGTWLYRIAVNEALMRRRSERRRPTQSLDALVPSVGDVGIRPRFDGELPCATDELVENKQLVERVRHALELLDESQRTALVLRDLEELSAEEAGEILGVSAETVRQRAHRARLQLRESLADVLGPAKSKALGVS